MVPTGASSPHGIRRQSRSPVRRTVLAQQAVLKTLRALPQIRYIGAAWGVGSGPWREASLFVVGPGTDAMDTMARQYGQNAYVHGHSDGPAQLRDCRGSAPHGQGR